MDRLGHQDEEESKEDEALLDLLVKVAQGASLDEMDL